MRRTVTLTITIVLTMVFVYYAMMLSGCAHTVSAPVVACPPMKTYTLAQQQEVAAALAPFPADAAIVLFITDYGQMRAADRACLGTR